jgi:Zn-finger nucleic acid-binding protein
MEEKKCPNCRIEMIHAMLRSHYNDPVELHQCPKCGGLWVEDHDIYRVKLDGGKQIDDIDSAFLGKFEKGVPLKDMLLCPTDEIPLIKPNKNMFPVSPSVIAEMCPTCHGVWFNYGSFSSYEKNRQKEIDERRQQRNISLDPETARKIEKMEATLALEEGSDTIKIKNIANFLTTPVRGGGFGSSRGLMPILMSTLSDAVTNQRRQNKTTSIYSDLPTSTIQKIKTTLGEKAMEEIAIQNGIQELNNFNKKRRIGNIKLLITIILLLFAILSEFITTKKQEEAGGYNINICFTQCKKPIDPNTKQQIFEVDPDCYQKCSEEHHGDVMLHIP